MELYKELVKRLSKRDDTPIERLDYSRVKATLEAQCEKYLTNPSDVFRFEALPSAINSVIEILTSSEFSEKYDYGQVTETVFDVRLKSLDLL